MAIAKFKDKREPIKLLVRKKIYCRKVWLTRSNQIN